MNNKKIVSLFAFTGIFGFIGMLPAASGSFQLTNPLIYNDILIFLWGIAWYVGSFIAALGTIMIIWAGILYLTSAGSPEKMTKAKTALTYAIIGIVVGISATTIVSIIGEIIGAKK